MLKINHKCAGGLGMSWLEIENKVVVVTGGSSGIGASIVKLLIDQGCLVANVDLREGDFSSNQLKFYQTDITNRESVNSTVENIVRDFGRIDALVNNAGINIPALLVDEKYTENGKYEISENLFDKMINVNQKGLYFMSQAVGKILVSQRNGVIVNMSSECGLEGSEGQSIYAATKAAVNSLTRSWAKELGKKNVRVVGVAPGIMEATGLRTIEYETALSYTRDITIEQLRSGYTNFKSIPIGREGKLEEVANLVAFFISDKSAYIDGVTINIAGGKTRG